MKWFDELVDDLQTIITEGVFISRWALLECYHNFGKRILEEHDNFEREKIYNEKIVQRIATSLGKSRRTIYCAIQFAKKYPDINSLPDGKNASWSKVVNKYLPEHRETSEEKEAIEKPDNVKVAIRNSLFYRLLEKYEPKAQMEKCLDDLINRLQAFMR